MGRNRTFDYEVAAMMHRDGNTTRELAAFFGVTHQTVARAVKAGSPPPPPAPPAPRPKGERRA